MPIAHDTSRDLPQYLVEYASLSTLCSHGPLRNKDWTYHSIGACIQVTRQTCLCSTRELESYERSGLTKAQVWGIKSIRGKSLKFPSVRDPVPTTEISCYYRNHL
ncbi:hypothetical protein BDR07DRAFT_1336330 [Suillus spraguei]|nr:hypothetical protein BDR07DRAFT_1336330 [Suillus spraguei]